MIVMRRFSASSSFANPCIFLWLRKCTSQSPPSVNRNEGTSADLISAGKSDLNLRNSLGAQNCSQLGISQIEVVDSDVWSVSSCLARVSKIVQDASQSRLIDLEEVGDGVAHNPKQIESDPDIEDVEDLRIRGKLFYKVEQSSLEFDEYKFDFHGSKFKSMTKSRRESEKKDDQRCDMTQSGQTSLKSKGGQQTIAKNENLKHGPLLNAERLAKTIKDKFVVCTPHDQSCIGKKLRTPTYNQLTGPYHEPFCLDIYVSKGSVRACVVHRVTSKVVIVAHSISKDMKFELGSTKSVAAATAVGKALAQRALEDDIHNVIYTPRKGDKLEGKLQVVLQSIINNGLNVKLKLKQKNPGKAIGRR